MKSFCRIVLAGLGLFGITTEANAQSEAILRLRTSLAGLTSRPDFTHDPAYVDTLDRLAYVFYGISSDSAFFYGRTALELSKRNGYIKGEAESWRILGNTYEMIGNYSQMLSCYHQSLDMAEKAGNKRQVAKATSNIALFDEQQGEYDKARALMEKVMNICLTEGDSVLVLTVYIHLSGIAVRRQQYELALQYARRALQAATATHEEPQVATCRNEVGRILEVTGDDREAIELYQRSMVYYERVRDQLGMASTSGLLAQAWLQLRDYPRALGYAQTSLTGAQLLHRNLEIRESSRALTDIYAATGDDRRALQYFKLYKNVSDSLFHDETHKRILALEAGYDFEKKESLLQQEEAMRDERYQRALREDGVRFTITILVIVILCLLAFILLRSRNLNRRMNQLLREKNEKIEEQKETLEHLAVQLLLNNRQKDKLFSIVSHDLRGPLNSLKTLMDCLKEKKLSEAELREVMNEFRRNVDYSSELVSNLLFWASSQLDGMVTQPMLLPVQPMVQDILALYSYPACLKNVWLNEDLEPSIYAFADKDMVEVILRNLISNAIKFCRLGDSVTVISRRVDRAVEICVADTGIGLKEEALDKIRRKESFTSYGTAKEKGTGLGILLCHEFAEANGGRFWIESEWGKGCHCYFTLPIGPAVL
jgi:two-component system, sensor histidine kinase and response regulator